MRKNFVLLSLIVYFAMFPVVTTGQNVSEKEVVDLYSAHAFQLDNNSNSNLSMIQQLGNENKVVSIQNQVDLESNLIIINQNGIGNACYIEQSGLDIKTYLYQYDLTNEANLWSVGKNIITSVKQNGDGNIINSYIENYGVNLRSAMLLQEGNQNRIDISLKGNGFINNSIEQTMIINQFGNHHEVTAFIEPFSAPVEINQYSGNGGEGMKVNISTSSFNFPMKK